MRKRWCLLLLLLLLWLLLLLLLGKLRLGDGCLRSNVAGRHVSLRLRRRRAEFGRFGLDLVKVGGARRGQGRLE